MGIALRCALQIHYELVACGQSPDDNVTSPGRLPPIVTTPSEYAPNDDYERVLSGAIDIQQVPMATVRSDLELATGGCPSDTMTLTQSPPPAYTVLDGHQSTPIHQVAPQQTQSDVIARRTTPQLQCIYFSLLTLS